MTEVLPVWASLIHPLEVGTAQDRFFKCDIVGLTPAPRRAGRHSGLSIRILTPPVAAEQFPLVGGLDTPGPEDRPHRPGPSLEPLHEHLSLEPHREVGGEVIRGIELRKHAWLLLIMSPRLGHATPRHDRGRSNRRAG